MGEVWSYRGYSIESSSVGSDIYWFGELILVKTPLGTERSIIDSWHYAK